MPPSALQLAAIEPSRARLSMLVLQLAVRQCELAAMRHELQELQLRYLREIGGLQGQLFRVQRLLEDEEIRAGIRPPRLQDGPSSDASPADEDATGALCSKEAPSPDVKRMFREIARMVHPDLATGAAAKYRRHSIMAEANRAYEERNEDRLRLIIRSWHREPDQLMLDADADPEHLMLTPEIQAEFVGEAPELFVPVAGGWGRMGVTHIRLAKANRDILTGALHAAWKLRVAKNAATRSGTRTRRR